MVLMDDGGLETWDIVALVGYFVLVVGVGLGSMFLSRRHTIAGFFLAGRSMNWLIVGASLFSSNIGSDHFIGLAGSGAADGIAVGAFEMNSMAFLQLLGWVFLPVYLASKVHTLPEYMKKRFGGTRIRVYLAFLSLMLYIFTKISVDLFSGAIFINQSLHWNIYWSIILLLAITAVSAITGGLTASIYLEVLQTVAILVGSIAVTAIGFQEVGGWSGLKERYMRATPNTTNTNYTECGKPNPDSFIMLRGISDSSMPWLAFIIGQSPSSIWYWSADQMIVQRTLAGKSLSHSQGGCILAAYLKILPLFTMVIPGMFSRILWPDEVACVDPDICERICGNRVGCSNVAYPKLVMRLLPQGFRGLTIAVMMGTLVSDLSSIFNSASSLFTMDIYVRFRHKASHREQLIVGRIFNAVLLAIAIAWIPLIQKMQGGQMYIYIQSIAAYLAPPIAATYLLAILWKRSNEQGAFWSLMIGLVVGVIRMIVDFIYTSPECGQPDHRPESLKKFHYFYYGFFVFCITLLVNIVISLLTQPQEEYRTIRTTYFTRFDETKRPDEIHTEPVVPGDVNLSHRMSVLSTTSDLGIENPAMDLSDENPRVSIDSSSSDEVADKPAAEKFDSRKLVRSVFVSFPKKGYDWFCGLNAEEEDDETLAAHEAKLDKAASIHQQPFVKTFLFVNVCVVLFLCAVIYAIFSTGII